MKKGMYSIFGDFTKTLTVGFHCVYLSQWQKADDEDFQEEQNLMARLVHTFRNENLEVMFKVSFLYKIAHFSGVFMDSNNFTDIHHLFHRF